MYILIEKSSENFNLHLREIFGLKVTRIFIFVDV